MINITFVNDNAVRKVLFYNWSSVKLWNNISDHFALGPLNEGNIANQNMNNGY